MVHYTAQSDWINSLRLIPHMNASNLMCKQQQAAIFIYLVYRLSISHKKSTDEQRDMNCLDRLKCVHTPTHAHTCTHRLTDGVNGSRLSLAANQRCQLLATQPFTAEGCWNKECTNYL